MKLPTAKSENIVVQELKRLIARLQSDEQSGVSIKRNVNECIWRPQATGGDEDAKKQTDPEQIFYLPISDSVQVLTRSSQDTVVRFSRLDGIKETPILTERHVLTDPVVRRLFKKAENIKRIFGGMEQEFGSRMFGG